MTTVTVDTAPSLDSGSLCVHQIMVHDVAISQNLIVSPELEGSSTCTKDLDHPCQASPRMLDGIYIYSLEVQWYTMPIHNSI